MDYVHVYVSKYVLIYRKIKVGNGGTEEVAMEKENGVRRRSVEKKK